MHEYTGITQPEICRSHKRASVVLSGAMSTLPSAADHEPGAGGPVEMERALTRLLIEYDELETAWPKCRHVLVRARAGRQATDTLLRISKGLPAHRVGQLLRFKLSEVDGWVREQGNGSDLEVSSASSRRAPSGAASGQKKGTHG